MSVETFYLNFIMENWPRPFEYSVTKETWEKVSKIFQEPPVAPGLRRLMIRLSEPETLHDLNKLIIFDDLETGRRIHIAYHYVCFFQALHDDLELLPGSSAGNPIRPVEFYLNGISLLPPGGSTSDLVDLARCIQAAPHIDLTRGLQFELPADKIHQLNVQLAAYQTSDDGFFSFPDSQGEYNSIRASKIMLVETPPVTIENS